MDLSTFYEECRSLFENEKPSIDAFFETVVNVFGDDDQEFENLHKVCLLFYGKRSTLSKAQYYQRRKFICRLYKWLFDCGTVSESFIQRVNSLKLQNVVSDSEIYRFYFKDLDAALDFVGGVGRMSDLGDYDDLLNIKSIVIMSWYQIEPLEMQCLRKSDLHSSSCTISVGDREVKLLPSHFNILKRFAEVDVHKGFPSGKTQFYKSSPFVMRSAQQINLNPNNIQSTIHRFNSISTMHGKEISTLKLKRNGLFYQVYSSDDKKNVNAIIQEITGCDRAFAFGYKELYQRWKILIRGGVDS